NPVDDGPIGGAHSDPRFPCASDPNVPIVNIPEITNRFGAELERVGGAFKITIPDVDVCALDFSAERVIAFQRQAVIATAGEIAIVHLNIPATDEIDRVPRFFNDDLCQGDLFAIVQQINKMTAGLVSYSIEQKIPAGFDRDTFVTNITPRGIVAFDD